MRNNPLRVYGEELWDGSEAKKVKVQGNMGGIAVCAIALEDTANASVSATISLLDEDETEVSTMACTFAGKAGEGEKIAATSAVVVPDEVMVLVLNTLLQRTSKTTA